MEICSIERVDQGLAVGLASQMQLCTCRLFGRRDVVPRQIGEFGVPP
jgi:hypothetical protein